MTPPVEHASPIREMRTGPRPTHLLLQWHITDRCNLNCRHCYGDPEVRRDDLPLEALHDILKQFIAFLNPQQGPSLRGHITLTGGEPFLRKDLFDLLEMIHAHRKQISFALLTNGAFLDRHTLRRLYRLRPKFVQLSLDGMERAHDAIRGNGDFKRTVNTISRITLTGIPVSISYTVHKDNMQDFKAVASLGRRLKAKRVWADRFIPMGNGSQLENRLMSPDDTRCFFETMRAARSGFLRQQLSATHIAMHRALQFLVGGGNAYRCSAGRTLLAVMPDGELYPCRRLPVTAGNLFDTPLDTLYDTHPLLLSLRDPHRQPEGCGHCPHVRQCNGGLRCLAYAMSGSPFKRDPGCWI